MRINPAADIVTDGSDGNWRDERLAQPPRASLTQGEHLHQSICLLPNRPDVRAALQPILLRVRAQGGTVRNLTIQVEGSDHDALVTEQRNERDEEYREVVEQVPAFLSEITMETARGRATYAEVEESEAEVLSDLFSRLSDPRSSSSALATSWIR